MTPGVFDERACLLGEGPLWHPLREQLFWFDILGRTLLTRQDGRAHAWSFEHMVSAAGWIDRDRLLIAGESGLVDFDIVSGQATPVATPPLGAGRRSNDGRADPWGGFWFSSMDKEARPGAGAIHRYFRGRVETLFDGLTIPNAICFSPDRRYGYFADTGPGIVRRVALDADTGRPAGEPDVFLDLGPDGLNPDGAVTDAQGNFWNAQWGAGRVAVYDPRGRLIKSLSIGAPNASCPAFGGSDFSTLYCTTARDGMDADTLAAHPQSGMVLAVAGAGTGRAEPRILL